MGRFHLSIAAAVALAALSGCTTLSTNDALAARADAARTPQDHLLLAAAYQDRAAEERAFAARHAVAASQERWVQDALLRQRPYTHLPALMRGHCDGLEMAHQRAAFEADNEAARHRRMAQDEP